MPVTQLINKDCTFFFQFGYATSQILAGAILVNQSAALLINCTESYGRSKTVDADHELRVGTTMHKCLFLKNATRYEWINTITTHEDNATKQKFGIRITNLLANSSIRADKYFNNKKYCNFIATDDTNIHI